MGFDQSSRAIVDDHVGLINSTLGKPTHLASLACASPYLLNANLCKMRVPPAQGNQNSKRAAQLRWCGRAGAVLTRATPAEEVEANKEKYAALPEQLGVSITKGDVGCGMRGRGLFTAVKL